MIVKTNIWIILISIFLALFFWVQSILLKEQSTIIAFPVIVNNAPVGFVNSNNIPRKLDFRIRGLGYEIVKLRMSKISVLIDYRFFLNQEADLSTADYKINIPSTANVEVLGPVVQVGIKDDKSYGKILQLPVQIDFADDETRNLFYQRNFSLAVNTLNVRVSNSTEESVKYIETEPLHYDMLKKDKFRLRLVSPSSYIKLPNQYVEINRSSSQLVTKVISAIPIQDELNTSFFPSEVTVRIRGLSEVIEKVTPGKIRVSLKAHSKDDKEIPVSVSLPSNIELIDYSPKKVLRNVDSEPK